MFVISKEILFYIWLSNACQLGSTTPYNVFLNVPDLEDFYNLTAEEMSKLEYVEHSDIKRLKTITIEDSIKILNDCKKLGINIITIDDEDYPKQLLGINGIPIILYYQGTIGFLSGQLIISVVGTRSANEYSKDVTFKISKDLASSGAIVVSGGAMGIDEYAHKGALSGKGRTIVIAGCGLDVNYPKENLDLRNEILAKNGAIISELPPRTNPHPSIFPKRNRIIAGLAHGVCVTHVPLRSGASITAQLAIDSGKDLFCLPPWDVRDSSCMGVMKFIRDGAKVIADAEDILMDYSLDFSEYSAQDMFKQYMLTKSKSKFELCLEGAKAKSDKLNAKAKKLELEEKNSENKEQDDKEQDDKEQDDKEQDDKEQDDKLEFDLEKIKSKWKDFYDGLDENEIKIFDSLTCEPQVLDEILAKTCVPITKVLSILTDFEIEGVVASHSGRRYSFVIDN